jgi:hypothetical protein
MSPAETGNVRKTALLLLLNRNAYSADAIVDTSVISMFAGRMISLRLDVTNFLGKIGSAFIDFNFLSTEGLIL